GALWPGILIEVEHITVEAQHRQSRAPRLALLDIAVEHDEPRTFPGLGQYAGLGEVSYRALRVAVVMHEDAADFPAGRQFADEHGEPFARRGEGAFAQNRRPDVRADVEHLVLHHALAE